MRIRPQITFDLGGVYGVGEVQIWNYNEAGATGTQPFRGPVSMI